MDKQSMSKEVFQQYRDFIYEKCGIFFADNKTYLLEDRLSRRLKEKNFASYEDYLNFLRYDARKDEELKEFYNSITTNETSFYRDPAQLEAFKTGVLQKVIKGKGPTDKKLRLWSSACSTGEEPYTLAMMAADEGLMQMGWNIEVLGTDISEQVIRSAKRATYGEYALRTSPRHCLAKYFSNNGDGAHTVIPEIRRLVRIERMNLMDSLAMGRQRGYDVIFCRNVLIYFDDNAKRKVVASFHESLADGGYLVLGFSETLLNLSRAFKPVGINRCVVYRKM